MNVIEQHYKFTLSVVAVCFVVLVTVVGVVNVESATNNAERVEVLSDQTIPFCKENPVGVIADKSGLIIVCDSDKAKGHYKM